MSGKKPFHFVHSTVNSVDVEIKVVMVSVDDLHSRRKHSSWEDLQNLQNLQNRIYITLV